MNKNFSFEQGSVQELNFDYPVISIGSHPDNDIVLSGSNVLSFHATIHAQNGAYHLIALGNTSSIKVDGKTLSASPAKIVAQQRVEIGNYALFFQQNDTPNSVHVVISKSGTNASTAPSQVITMPEGESPILVNAPVQQAEIDVEQPALYELEVVNAGPIVASFSISLDGVPSEWVEISPRLVNLNEGQRTRVQITVTPPREPASTAGKRALRAQVQSVNYGGYQVTTQLGLTIRPYYDFSIGTLSPKDQYVPWRKRTGKTQFTISNNGNSAADFNISAMDDENGCTFDLAVDDNTQLTRQAIVHIPSGEKFTLPMQITPHKRSLFAFSSKRYQYTTTVQVPQAVAPQMTSGSVSAVPLFGWWSIVLGIMALALMLFILLQPYINNFQVAAGKDVIELGDTTRLEWSVSPFATNVSISGIDQAIERGQSSLTIAPQQSTTYTLNTSNWLSSLLRQPYQETLTVLVVPPSPRVNVFEVNEKTVAKGKPITLRWSVTRADQAVLTIDDVVYELGPEEFSGERDVVLEKNALVTLEAKNASGSELRSYYINVEEPNITVRTFTVWVRSKDTSQVTPLGGNKGASILNVPDPNFPEKYVGLIKDPTSDAGYRVEFYQPDRELSKGEQIILEWNIEGTDNGKIQIAPFTDALPSQGSQPFFPQESMNFVLTAKSGELEQLYMLPVVVFDGIPPAAPKIDIYKAAPLSMVGKGKVQFAWSVSGDWTRIQLANGKGIVADYMNPQDFKTVDVGNSDTFILTAWNGKLTSSQALDITVNPALLDPGLTIESVLPTTLHSQVGGKVNVTIGFSLVPTGGTAPTGSVTVTDGSAICNITLPAVTCPLIFTTSGTKTITASFPGDKIYQQSQSAGYAPAVIVDSSQVDLTPTFFFNDNSNLPISVESSTFSLDKGMHVIVEVRPKNTVLADDNGNINISLCDQDGAGSAVLSTCTFVGASSVKVEKTGTATRTIGYGYADITIANFNATGVRAMLISYSHSLNSIDPTSLTQPNIHISRSKLSLSYSSCSDPITLTNCNYGFVSGATPQIIFDLTTPGVGSPIPLSSLLPAPQSSAFTVTSVPAVTWTCTVRVISGTYKLDCKAPVGSLSNGTTYTITYKYDNFNPLASNGARNDYYMGTTINNSNTGAQYSNQFQLAVLASTKVVIGDLSGVKVGDRIQLSTASGLVTILNGDGSTLSIYPSAGMTLSEKGGANIFGLDNVGSNCVLSSGGDKITVTAANADCYFYFKHAGNYTLVATFAGSGSNNASTSGDTPITVQKQIQISGTLQYLTGGVYSTTTPTSMTTNLALPVRVVLDGPNSTFATAPNNAFPASALANRMLLVTLNAYGQAHCTVDTSANSLVSDQGSGVYQVTITQKPTVDPTSGSTGTPVTAADINITCSTVDGSGLSLTYAFSDKTTPKDSDDFGFASAVALNNLQVQEPSTGSMTISITRKDTDNTVMLTGTTISQLHFGQQYNVSVTGSSSVGIPYQYSADYRYTYTYPDAGGYTYSGGWLSDPNVASSSARTSALSGYSATWSVDPANFLTYGTSLSNGGTCTTGMSLHPNSGSYSEYSQWAWLGWNYYYTGSAWVYTYTYRAYYYGTQYITLNSVSPCTLIFDTTSSDNVPVAAPSGTIAVTALSSDKLFKVNQALAVSGIDKQTTNMTFTGPYSGYTNIALPVSVSLKSGNITGGTSLPFTTGTTFTGFFSTTVNTTSCPSLSAVGSMPPIKLSFTSVSDFGPCQNNTLQYVGNKYFKSVTQTIPDLSFSVPGPTTATVTAPTTNTSFAYGASIKFDASVVLQTPNGNTPTGTIQFQDSTDGGTNYSNLGSPVTMGGTSGTATASYTTTASLSVGTHKIRAVYTSNDNTLYSSSTSAAISIIITQASTSTTMVASPSSNWPNNSATTFTATVTSSGTPVQTGNVNFQDNNTTMTGGTIALDSNGRAQFSITLSAGPHSITAVYAGNTNYATSTSVANAQTAYTPTSTTLTSNNTSFNFGDTATFTATINIPAPASGTVSFFDGGVEMTSAGSPVTVVTNAGERQATLSLTTLTPGSHTISARYNPASPAASPFYGTSTSANRTVTVNKATPTISISLHTGSLASNPYGTNVTFDAAVLPAISGTVQFYDGASPIGSAATVTAGAGTFSYANLGVASSPHSITAIFTPNSTYSPSYNPSGTSNTLNQTVTKATPTITISLHTGSLASNPYGTNVTYDIAVTPSISGTAQFSVDGSTAGVPTTATVTAGAGTFSTSSLTSHLTVNGGTSHTITAVFTPTDTANYNNSATSNTLNQTVTKATTSVTITQTSTTPSPLTNAGGTVSFSISVPGGLSGTVQFYDGASAIGSPATVTNGTGTFTTPAITGTGTSHPIKAVFTPTDSANYSTSPDSNTVTVTIP